MEYKKLLDMNTKQCTYSRKTANTGNLRITCKYAKNSTYTYVKAECFCADTKATLDLECNKNQRTLCCDNETACFNGGQLKEESDCSTPEPIIECKCPTVLNGTGRYQGNRCQNISVIRQCIFQSSANESYKSCDDEETIYSHCIHTVNNTSFECGPVHRTTDGMVYTKCERRNVNSTPMPRKLVPTGDGLLIGGVLSGIALVLIVLAVTVIIFCVRRSRRNYTNTDSNGALMDQLDQSLHRT
ncbi:uncharacterized protein LOC117327661 isoform X1 [Pecten maximus]|uniref:uncharacterized protein LOC117327661 isoform X1 n=1 Tax=Pecten maximus TaxID=6579 RepID=UPI001458FB5E|nr:uncharacterized protein LOC117327661 isoform X1 [Pecten maximus]XP_033740628.1 uncharacterized protein LOC117327661 isoform X1 [Pecten maximus]XP_033740629.1 uncharacterized protein LOC117327661 isoform X1 [Pecten maximus]